jgi:hypothetical protein
VYKHKTNKSNTAKFFEFLVYNEKENEKKVNIYGNRTANAQTRLSIGNDVSFSTGHLQYDNPKYAISQKKIK